MGSVAAEHVHCVRATGNPLDGSTDVAHANRIEQWLQRRLHVCGADFIKPRSHMQVRFGCDQRDLDRTIRHRRLVEHARSAERAPHAGDAAAEYQYPLHLVTVQSRRRSAGPVPPA